MLERNRTAEERVCGWRRGGEALMRRGISRNMADRTVVNWQRAVKSISVKSVSID